MAGLQTFKNLEIWQLAMGLAERIYRISASFPAEEKFGITSQVRRAAISIPSNIAEGWGRGQTRAQAGFLRIARGSLMETESLLLLAERLGYVSLDVSVEEEINKLTRKLNAYLSAIENSVAEPTVPYDPQNS